MKASKVLVLLLSFSLFVFLSCDTIASKIHKNPEEYLIKKLKNKQILMIGDFGHQQPCPYYSLIEILKKWVSLVEQGCDVDKHIVLVLEHDSAEANLLKNFIKTNDLKPLFDHWLSYNGATGATLELCEFFSNLRRLSIKIDTLNARLPAQIKITFDIFGPEDLPSFDPNDSLDKLIDRFEYFLNNRDILTARHITEYLGVHKNTKAIIYYGNGHLNKSLTEKNIFHAQTPKNENTKGYYLAHYLKKTFGNGQVLTVNQMFFDPQRIKQSIADKAGTDNFYVETASLFRKFILFPMYDGFIVRREHSVCGHAINKIISKYVIKTYISKMDSLLTDTTNAMLKLDYQRAVRMLPYLCGVHFEYPIKPESWFRSNKPAIVVHEWKEWFNKNDSTISRRIDSKDFENLLKQMYIRSLDSKNTRELQSIGFRENMWNFSEFSEGQWDSLIWPEAINRIKCINSIGKSWFGDSLEQKTSHDFLISYTGKNFSDPDLYLRWFRNQKDSVSY